MNARISKNRGFSKDASTIRSSIVESETRLSLWSTSFPQTDFEPSCLKIPPELEVPLSEINRPDDFPPFLLLGKRVDSSFCKVGDETTIEYEWPRHSSTPVARISVTGNRGVRVEEPWNGESSGFSFGCGDTLGKALSYKLMSLAFRDARLRTSEGVLPHEADPREGYFVHHMRTNIGVEYTRPVHGRTCLVEHPAGILRALAIPCLAKDTGFFRKVLATYLSSPDAYVQAGLPGRLAHGSFSHRSAVVEWEREGRKHQREELELKLFVGPWRAAIELVETLAANGWDFRNPRLPAAVVCVPQELARPLEYNLDGSVIHLPVLLPPQEALGVVEGCRPSPLGDVAFRDRGGDPQLLERLGAAVDAIYPKADVEQGQWVLSISIGSPRPIFGLCRSMPRRTPTVPVLFVLGKGKLDPPDASNWPPFARLSGGTLPLVDTAQHGDDFLFVVPNLPFLNECHDEEGFHHLLPDVVRYIEEEYGTAWLVARCGFMASHGGRMFSPYPNLAGLRCGGW